MRTSLAPAESASASSSEPWLEVKRGRTRAPRRDIRGRRFLIGGGSNCQLQLGGHDVPILHSILLVEEDGAHIDSVVSAPQLLVNGRPERSADLRDGDVFSIGKFEFQVHVPQPIGALQASENSQPPVPQSAEELGRLSMAQLVALLEAEQEQVAGYESGRKSGAEALLDTVRRIADSKAAQPVGAAEQEDRATREFILSLRSIISADEQAA